jgi:hypothetical protein
MQEGVYLHNQDLISRFRFFENGSAEALADAREDVRSYLEKYTQGPPTKAELLERIADGKPVDQEPLLQRYQIRRTGKDKDDLFWKLGKVHGIEYIAFCSEEELKSTGGDPIKLQQLINRVIDEDRASKHGSFDSLLSKLQTDMPDFKAAMKRMAGGKDFMGSDSKKLLALPFFLEKRQEDPEPKRGQREFGLFKELYGVDYDKFAHLNEDLEEKINEFNFEYHLSPEHLKEMDTQSERFKEMIKTLNFTSLTEFEQHREQ